VSTSEIVEAVVRVIAETALDNEAYFCELDSVAGDGDFGYSLARGFEVVLETWDEVDRTNDPAFLRAVAATITSRTGGTSGPIWGTAFLRASGAMAQSDEPGALVAVVTLRAAITGIQARGKAEVGDKTLLDALVPATDALERALNGGASTGDALEQMVASAREGAEATKDLQARRGRASYTGARSIGSLDPGAVAVAVMSEAVVDRIKPLIDGGSSETATAKESQ
jgi:dihydroxyacetone kinase-like protein